MLKFIKEPVAIMEGQWIRFNRLFSSGPRAVIVALDHGEFSGPIPGVIDLPEAIQSFDEADGLLLSPGMLAHCGSMFARRNAPQALVRLDWSTVYCGQWAYGQARNARVVCPQEALALGADIALASFTLTGTDPQQDRDNVAHFADLVSQKRRAGLPLIAELYPLGPANIPPDDLHRLIFQSCRIVCELGADAVKTFYTGEAFAEIVESCPIPIFTLGAEKTPTELEALTLAYRSIRSGARGVVFGRNIFQADSPARFLRALKKVVKEDADPEAVGKELNLR